MMSAKHAIGLVIILISIALSSWYLTKAPVLKKLDKKTLASTADLFIHKLSVRQFDKNGQLMHQMQSPLVHHIPENDTHLVKSPQVIISQENQPPRNIHAEQATTHHNGEQITLNKQVVIHQEKDTHNEESTLKAQSADLDLINYKGIFIGDVQLDQGSSHVRAARAVTYGNKNNQLTKAVIYGDKEKQTHYWTIADINKPPMHAYADTLYYYHDKHLIKLIGHAKVEQGRDSFSAPSISYDTLHKHIVSTGNEKQQTTIIIHPGKTP